MIIIQTKGRGVAPIKVYYQYLHLLRTCCKMVIIKTKERWVAFIRVYY